MNELVGLTPLSLIGCFVGISGCFAGTEAPRPNILYIFTDDQSNRTVSCYPEAYSWVRTPNIDLLAKEGMRFSSCYTGTWSMPSRATMLTGMHPHGIQSLRMTGPYPQCSYDPDSCSFWPSDFRKAGYFTGIVGKWHTGSDDGYGRDWDYSAVWNVTLPKNTGCYVNQKINFNGGPLVPVGGYSTDNYTEYALDFIRVRSENKDQPWFLWLCYDAPHGPYIPAERHKNEYKDTPPVPVPADIFPPRPQKPRHMNNYGVWKKDENGNPFSYLPYGTRVNETQQPVTLDEAVRVYNRPVLAVDEAVGKVMDALRQSGQLENTIVIFTSDQGYAWGQHGFIWKYAPYDANLKAPLIIRWPGKISPGTVCHHPIGGHDLIPTFFSLAGIRLPWKMHGHDISPMFRDPECKWKYPLLLENTGQLFGQDVGKISYSSNKGFPCWIFLREGKYKYIRTLVEDEIEELYDLEKDPEELTNLALSPGYEKTLSMLRKKMIRELKRTDAVMADKLPEIKMIH